ncbi:MAG TPA: hypothetical protein ENH82_18895 [bacterium]|nr:hypothetical protein [bacterium]
MAETKRKGDIGEAMIMADILRRGYKIAIPWGEDWSFDLIAYRKNVFERVQCKYIKSDGRALHIPCRSINNWSIRKYTKNDIDWLVAYDKTTNCCYYISSDILGSGMSSITLRFKKSKNNQYKNIRWAEDFKEF